MNLDEDALIAAVDLIGRSGAREFEIGWDCPHVPDEPDDHTCPEVTWQAHAKYKGARLTAQERGPIEAAEALARRILDGAKCARCGRLVALSDAGAVAYDSTLLDGSRWTVQQAAAAGQCRWTRHGRRWQQGCEPLPAEHQPNRQQRRAAERRRRRKGS